MMVCKRRPDSDEAQCEIALKKVNDCSQNMDIKPSDLQQYIEVFLEAVRVGAIHEFTIKNKTYELYADILETEE